MALALARLVYTLAAAGAAAAAAATNATVPPPFTPVDMLAAPRPQAAIASPDGALAISVVDQWDPKEDSTLRTVYLLNLTLGEKESAPVPLFSSSPGSASELLWIADTTIAYLNGSTLYHFSVNDTVSSDSKPKPIRPLHLLDFPKGSDPSGIQYERQSGTLVFSAAVWTHDGDLTTTGMWDSKYTGRGDSGVVYDDLFVRHWDTWRTPGRVYTLASTKMERKKDEDGFVATKTFVNLLNGTGLYSQMDPIDASAFTLSSTHVAFALKPPHLNVATHTRVDVFLLPHGTPGLRPTQLTPGSQGAVSGLKFSPDGQKIAWLEMAKDGYESDRRVVVVYTIGSWRVGTSERWTQEWDRSPNDLSWAGDSESLYLLAEHRGKVLPYHLSRPGRLPTPLLFSGSTSSITQLTPGLLLVSKSSLTSPTEVFILDLDEDGVTGTNVDAEAHLMETETDPHKLPAEALRNITNYSGEYIGGRLDGMAGEEFLFTGAEGKSVMAWVLKPRGWTEADAQAKAQYPLAFFIHGGPQGAWEDAWSTRWNPAVFASMGYFVVAVNPTGSTGYGQEFTDRIQAHWGDRPFKDLVAGYYAALRKYPEIDPERTAALGASFGGYMINWINGHNVFGFKALVYHDGILDTTDMYYATEEVWFPQQDFDGTPLTGRSTYEMWNPMNHVGEWTTPQLVIQGGKDFRLPESQAIGTFTALQLQGVPSRFLYFPDENHWVMKASNSRRWHHEVLRWLDEWVGHGKKGAGAEAALLAVPDPLLEPSGVVENESRPGFVVQ